MTTLIDKLFSQPQADAIRTLLDDTGSRHLMQKEIGKTLLDYNQITEDHPLEQIMVIVSLSPFANSENECCEVAGIIYWGIHRIDIIPMVSKHSGKDLAYRCLVSLGLFKQYLIRQCERYGAPSPLFYRQVGIKSFENIGMEDIGGHFNKWENFISEFFV